MKNILIILIALSLTSCTTKRACERKYPAESASVTGSTSVTYIRDTIIQVQIVGDTLMRTFATLQDTMSILHSDFSTSIVKLENGYIHHSLNQKDTVVNVTVKGALKTLSKKEWVNTSKVKEPTNRSSFVDMVVWPIIQLAFTLFIFLLALKAFSHK